MTDELIIRMKATPAAPHTETKRPTRRGTIPSSFITSASHSSRRIKQAPETLKPTMEVGEDQDWAPPAVKARVRETTPEGVSGMLI